MARGRTVTTRAARLLDLASSAENIGDLALVADQTLAKARADLLTLAGAARKLADRLTAEANSNGGTK